MNIWKKIKFCFNYFKIPKGEYCRHCPYWDLIDGLPHQESGYCHWLDIGDTDINNDNSREFKNVKTGKIITAPEMPIRVGLLWDGVKECNLRHYSDKELRKNNEYNL